MLIVLSIYSKIMNMPGGGIQQLAREGHKQGGWEEQILLLLYFFKQRNDHSLVG